MANEYKTLADFARESEELCKSFHSLLNTWERLSADDEEKIGFLASYPFGKSFDELILDVFAWRDDIFKAARENLNGKKLDKDNKVLVFTGDILRFGYGDGYKVTNVIRGANGTTINYTLQDIKTNRVIYSERASECYGATIETAKEE